MRKIHIIAWSWKRPGLKTRSKLLNSNAGFRGSRGKIKKSGIFGARLKNLLLLAILCLGFTLMAGLGRFNQPVVNYFSDTGLLNMFHLSNEDGKKFMQKTLAGGRIHEPLANKDLQVGLLNSVVQTVTKINVFDPRTFFQSQIALIDALPVSASSLADSAEPEEINEGEIEEDYSENYSDEENSDEKMNFLPGEAVVGIYTTHNAETYQPTDGKAKLEGKNAGVSLVAEELAKELQDKYQIPVVRSDVIHDYPDWLKSYSNSLKTAQQLLKANPSLQILFDIHRDAGLKTKETVKINDKEAAKILIIVGMKHGNWQANYEFANKVKVSADELYPGLVKGVRLRESGRYNQHLHPQALLIEVGSEKNSLDEALTATRAFAEVVSKVVKKN